MPYPMNFDLHGYSFTWKSLWMLERRVQKKLFRKINLDEFDLTTWLLSWSLSWLGLIGRRRWQLEIAFLRGENDKLKAGMLEEQRATITRLDKILTNLSLSTFLNKKLVLLVFDLLYVSF